jgi:hypothetical protein
MGLFSSIVNTVVDVAVTPVAVVKDVVTLNSTKSTARKVEDIGDDLNEVADAFDDLIGL